MEGAEAGTSQEMSGLELCLDKPGKGQMRHCLKGASGSQRDVWQGGCREFGGWGPRKGHGGRKTSSLPGYASVLL